MIEHSRDLYAKKKLLTITRICKSGVLYRLFDSAAWQAYITLSFGGYPSLLCFTRPSCTVGRSSQYHDANHVSSREN